MKRTVWALSAILVVGAVIASAQPPAGPGGPDGPGRRPAGGPDGPGPRNLLVDALDQDHDGEISAEEIKNASTSLAKLDKNQDGKLTGEEFRPPFPGGPDGPFRRGFEGVPGGRRPEGDPNPDRRRPEDRGPGDRPPEGRRPEGRGPGPRGPEGDRGPGPGGPDGGPGGPDGPPAGPNPERMVEHAMSFDADQDGKLSREELLKFAEEFARRRPGRGGPDGPGPRDGDARGPRDGGPREGGPRDGDGRRPREGEDRPERPGRPE